MKYLIVNGDDLGASPGVNRGILEAHQNGIVTSASLLVDTPWSSDAAAACRTLASGLSVGLHVDLRHLLYTRALLPPGSVRRAIDLQCARFEAMMGRPPTHLDAHHNLHRDPRALPRFLETARRLDVPLREHSPARYLQHYYGRWAGESRPDQVDARSLARLLTVDVEEGVTELGCHPGYADTELRSTYAVEREVELCALCDPSVRVVLERHAIRLISFQDLRWVSGQPAA